MTYVVFVNISRHIKMWITRLAETHKDIERTWYHIYSTEQTRVLLYLYQRILI